jgi:platelet-activating factor acetylhydrolase
MLFLSEIQGPFAVGAVTFVTPVQPSRIISAAKLKRRDSTSELPAEPALCLQEVAFTAYYPAKISSETPNKGIPWLTRLVHVCLATFSANIIEFCSPIKESLHGFARFLCAHYVSPDIA